MTDPFLELYKAALTGVMANSSSYTERADKAQVAFDIAQKALSLYRDHQHPGKHSHVERTQREFARKIEENGHDNQANGR